MSEWKRSFTIWNALKNHLEGAYRKSSIRSQPLIQVYSIRGRVIGGSVPPLIIGKILNPSKLPYLHYHGLVKKEKKAHEALFGLG